MTKDGEELVFSYARELKRLVRTHEKWRTTETLNLLSSENSASLEVRRLLSSDLSNRYNSREVFYRGIKYANEIETLASEVAKKVYRCRFADVRSLSGHTCSIIVFLTFLKEGDKIVTTPPKFGGYPGSSELGLGKLLRLRNLYFPFDEAAMNIIPLETRKLLDREKPMMAIFGASHFPFPVDLNGSIPTNYDGVKVFDGSHVMGLIGGGEFQQPLREGCSILMGSTHKSLFGPQGGIILSSDPEVFASIDEKIFPGIVDNIHVNRVASLCLALLELLKFGNRYATQVVRNSQALARSLNDLGINVRCAEYGFTKSHQVLLGYSERESRRIADALERFDVITDQGIRLGTSEVTRHGMKEQDMETIATIIHDVIRSLSSKSRPGEEIRKRVHRFVKEFQTMEFTLYPEL